MVLVNALTLKGRYLLIAALLGAFAFNALASLTDAAKLKSELSNEESYAKWIPESSQVALEQALDFDGNEENTEAGYRNFAGLFSSFYLRNAREYENVCRKALSLSQCRPLIWEKTQELLGEKVAASVEWSVNELLFLNNNPYQTKLRINKAEVFSSLGLGEGPNLKEALESHVFQFNQGRFKTSLFNEHPEYAQAAKLLGRMRAGEMSALLLDGDEARKFFAGKFQRARKIFEIEWKLFAANVLLPHSLLTALQEAAARRMFLDRERAREKALAIGLGMCARAGDGFSMSPEIFSFCQFLHQNK